MAQFKPVHVPVSSPYFALLHQTCPPNPVLASTGCSPDLVLSAYANLLQTFDTGPTQHLIRSNTFDDFLLALQVSRNSNLPSQPLEMPASPSDVTDRRAQSLRLRSPRLGRMVRKMNDGLASPISALFAKSPQWPKQEVSSDVRRRRRMRKVKRLNAMAQATGNDSLANLASRLQRSSNTPATGDALPPPKQPAGGPVTVRCLEGVLPEYHIWDLFSALNSVLPSFSDHKGSSGLPSQQLARARLSEAAQVVAGWLWEAIVESWHTFSATSVTHANLLTILLKKAAKGNRQPQTSIRRMVSGFMPASPFRPVPIISSPAIIANQIDGFQLYPREKTSTIPLPSIETEDDYINGKSALSYTVQELAGKLVDLISKMVTFDFLTTNLSTPVRFSILTPEPAAGSCGSKDSLAPTDKWRTMLRSNKVNRKIDQIRSRVHLRLDSLAPGRRSQRRGTVSECSSAVMSCNSACSSCTGLSVRPTADQSADAVEEAIHTTLQSAHAYWKKRDVVAESSQQASCSPLFLLYFVLAFRSLENDISILAAGVADPDFDTISSSSIPPSTGSSCSSTNPTRMPIGNIVELSNMSFQIAQLSARLKEKAEQEREREHDRWWQQGTVSAPSTKPSMSTRRKAKLSPLKIKPSDAPRGYIIVTNSPSATTPDETRSTRSTTEVDPSAVLYALLSNPLGRAQVLVDMVRYIKDTVPSAPDVAFACTVDNSQTVHNLILTSVASCGITT